MEKHYLGYRRAKKLAKQNTGNRNDALIARYYYLSEIRRLRFDDTTGRLSATFFISEAYVMKILGDSIAQFDKLKQQAPTREHLRAQWPEYDWA